MEGSKRERDRPGAPGASTRHLHNQVTVRVVEQRRGIPNEIRRTVCTECGTVLAEQRLSRTLA